MPRKEDSWETSANPREYEAFQSADKILATEIRLANGITWSMGLAYLLAVVYGHRHFTSIKLIYTTMVIHLKGERLHDVATALKLRKCSVLCQFSPKDHDKPADNLAIIHSIEITVKNIPDMIAEAEKGLDLG